MYKNKADTVRLDQRCDHHSRGLCVKVTEDQTETHEADFPLLAFYSR